jgi:hypothetical protein
MVVVLLFLGVPLVAGVASYASGKSRRRIFLWPLFGGIVLIAISIFIAISQSSWNESVGLYVFGAVFYFIIFIPFAIVAVSFGLRRPRVPRS